MKHPKATFKRLVTHLPYNPSLINQISFYAKRLKQESSIRRLGFVFITLTFFVQMFAVIAPPTATSAHDFDNDMISGGINNQGQAVDVCNNSQKDYGTVLAYFGITCADVANAGTQTISSTDYNGQLYSMGRKPYGLAGEYTVNVNGRDYFMRPLHAWDHGGTSYYKALVGTSRSGLRFMILYDCGNITVVGRPAPPPPAPIKTASCSILLGNHASGEILKKGWVMSVRGQITGAYLPAGQTVNMYYDYINLDTGKEVAAPVAHPGIPFVNGLADDKNFVNFTLAEAGHYQFRMSGTWDGGKLIAGSLQGQCLRNISVEKPPVDVCTDIPGLQTDITQCKPCKDATHNNPVACLVLAKTVRNDTTKLENADGTEAHAGDVLTYTLTTKNTGKATVKQYIIQESISDVLDYADVVDLHGGTKNNDNSVRWPAVDIKAGATITKQITVRVKNPIPQTPVSTSNPGKFDLTMTNVYGNATNVKLPPSVIKTTEQATTSLPNTGPGSNLIIAFAILSIAGYFFYRSRLMGKELDIIRQESTGA